MDTFNEWVTLSSLKFSLKSTHQQLDSAANSKPDDANREHAGESFSQYAVHRAV